MYISELRLVDILRDKMGENEARTLVEYIETQIDDKFLEAHKVFATKEDLLKLELKIVEVVHKGNLETQKLISESRVHSEKFFGESREMILESRVHFEKMFAESKSNSDKMFAESREMILESRSHSEKMFAESKLMIAESKTDLIKWMFGMILSSTIAIIGTVLVVMKMGGW